ncbi:hypothetical protein [Cerasicoccus maritimus]|uniref:hypothetical protein n=1 Tax=Cerasicoccus maritimus TaxID=490089 RepID=UPI0028529A42|nr:hypothetical protein [Cerasicoccus maritimus]
MSAPLPNTPQAGKQVLATWGRDVVRFLKSLRPLSGPDIIIHRGSNGWTPHLANIPKSGGNKADDHPWKPYSFDGLDVRLIPGTVNGHVLASNWNAALALSANATGHWVWIEVTVDQRGDAVSALLVSGATIPTTAAPANDGTIPTKLYAGLFSFNSSNTTVTKVFQAAKENLAVEVTVTDPACDEVYRSARIINA